MTKKIANQVYKWIDIDLDTKIVPAFLILQVLILLYLVK